MDKKLMDKVAMERLSEADKGAFKAAKNAGDSQMLGRQARVKARNTPGIEAGDVDKETKRLGKSYYKQTFDTPEEKAKWKSKQRMAKDDAAFAKGYNENDASFKKQVEDMFAEYREKEKSQGSALKKAESTAPAYKNAKSPMEKAKKSISFAAMERDLPQGGGKVMKIAKELEPDDAVKATIEKMMPGNKIKKTLGRMGKAGLVGGAVGLGINALMEGLDAEEAGSEEEKLDEVAMGQAMKTEAKIKAEKAAMKPKSLPASTKKSYPTKEKVKALPQRVKKTVVETRAPMPMGKSEDDIMEEFNQEGKRNIPDWSPGFADKLKQKIEGVPVEGMDEAVGRSMKREFKKAAEESNKKPISTYIKR